MTKQSVLTGETTSFTGISGALYHQQLLTNGDRVSWTETDPYVISIAKPDQDGSPTYWASTEFDGWEDSTTYDEVGFFVKEDGKIRFARTAFNDWDVGDLHVRAFIEVWNKLTGHHYELMGDGIGWAACKRGRNDVPPGVDLKDVHSFYYLDADLNPIN